MIRNQRDESIFKLSDLSFYLGTFDQSELKQEADGRYFGVHLVNAYSLACAVKDPYLQLIFKQDFILCDSLPIARYFKLRGEPIRQIRGVDLMKTLLRTNTEENRHFLIGGETFDHENLMKKILNEVPNVKVVGSIIPPHQDNFDEEIPLWLSAIRASEANIVWVGLGTPKQDYVVHKLGLELGYPVIAVGAAFDFLSGKVRESPMIFRFLGMEWLFRLISEPKRLWRRYLFGNAIAFKLLVKDLFSERN